MAKLGLEGKTEKEECYAHELSDNISKAKYWVENKYWWVNNDVSLHQKLTAEFPALHTMSECIFPWTNRILKNM